MPNLRPRRDSAQSQWPPKPDAQLESEDDTARKAALDWEARLVSEKIDLGLSIERSRKKKKENAVKILLLGQAESGKSTTLRNFQLNLAPRAFQADAEAWRTVIHLNLLISVNYLLDVLRRSLLPNASTDQRPLYTTSTPSRQLVEREKLRLQSLDGAISYPSLDSRSDGRSSPTYSAELRRLMLSLLPLKSIETTLRQRLGAEGSGSHLSGSRINSEPEGGGLTNNAKAICEPFDRPTSAQSSFRRYNVMGFRRHSVSSSATSTTSSTSASGPNDADRQNAGFTSAVPLSSGTVIHERHHSRRGSKLYGLVDSFAVRVRGSTGWKHRARIPDCLSSERCEKASIHENEYRASDSYSRRPSLDTMSEQEERELLSARQIIQVFGEDIETLWHNDDVQRLLKRQNIRLENRPGFFLNDVMRITAFDYIPSTSDILRARLSTTGVEEHRLVLETGPEEGKEWIIYDVGGFRSQRAAWAPFFDSVNAIIFLAPISTFDEWLIEDPSVNRLEDSLHLWREICSNHLLASVEFILFLNKYDALRSKLRSGIRFADYVVNYDDKDGTMNNADSIARYLLATFNAAHKQLSPKHRKLRAYLTSVIDSRATSKVVNHISQQVLVGHLRSIDVL